MSFWMVANTKGRSWLEKWLAAGESPIASCEAFRAWVSGAFSHSLQAFVFLPTQGALHPFPVHHIASIRIARSYDGRIQSKNNIMHMYIYIYIIHLSLSLSIYIHTYIHTYDSYHHLSNASYSTGERHPFSSNSSLQATSDAMGVHPIVACPVYPIIYIYI